MPGYADPFGPPNPGPSPGGISQGVYLNSDPEAGFWKYLQGLGLNRTDNDPTSRFAQGSYNRVYNNYKADAASDPNMGFWDYLNQKKPNLAGDFQSLAPEQRGDFSSRMLTPRARWVVG